MRRLPTFTDERGRLLVAEDAELGFSVRRVFAVTGVPDRVVRGEHVVPCRQAMVLVAGEASVLTGSTRADATESLLREPGDTIDLPEGNWVSYTLSSADAVIMVFAAAPFRRKGRT